MTDPIQPEKPDNIFYRIALWWESRRTAKRSELKALTARLELLEKNAKLASELASAKQRLDRLELFVGMKRQPTQQPQPGEARVG